MFLHLGSLINQTLKPPKSKLSEREEEVIKDKKVQSFWLPFIQLLIESRIQMECHFALIKKNENNYAFYFQLGHLVGSLKYN